MPTQDPWVLKAQQWVNSHYSGVANYVEAPENGYTGWPTMYALTRALQIELGIAVTSQNFGTQTMTALTTQYPAIDGSINNPNVKSIIQCALWCKGYVGGYDLDTWDAVVDGAVQKLLSDAGVVSTTRITPKIFKSILTMDAYVKVSGGTDGIRAIQRWFNGRYLNRRDFNLSPCDGIYSRNVQIALVYAIQYETGLADGVANGNFGPATQQGVKDHGVFGQSTINDTWRLLYQAALIFNGYANLVWNGVFDAQTAAQTRALQTFVEIPVTGTANYTTWAALMTSTGDTSRTALGIDTSTPLTAASAAQLYSKGYRHIGRYISGNLKRISSPEMELIWAAGLKWYPIYQDANDSAGAFTEAQGRKQGQQLAIAMRQLGMPEGAIAYLAVDFDATDDDITALIIPFFQHVRETFNGQTGTTYKLGVYGARNICSRLAKAGLTDGSFVSDMSTGYSGNLAFPLPADWAYDQIQNVKQGTDGLLLEIDRDVTSSRARSFGSSDLRRTPRAISNGVSTGFDKTGYWAWAALSMGAERAASSHNNMVGMSFANDLILYELQKPAYWIGSGLAGFAWSALTPIPGTGTTNQALITAYQETIAEFEALFGTADFPRPSNTRLGDSDHFAASCRVWMRDVPFSPNLSSGDLGSWGLDLVTLWNDYSLSNTTQSVGDWMRARLGTTATSRFDWSDLQADAAAFLVSKRMNANPSRPLEDIIRELLVAIESDHGWLIKTWVAERFGSISTARACASAIFTENWQLTGITRVTFVTADGAGYPTSAQIDEIADAFRDSVLAAETNAYPI